jgi:ketosteroid isomerase-like protein
MSQEYVELVRLGFEALFAGDTSLIPHYTTPDMEIVQPPEVPDAKTYKGRFAFQEAMADWPAQWKDFRMEVTEIIDACGDSVLSVTRHRGRGHHSEIEMDFKVFYVHRFRDGKLARIEMYFSREQALKAVGLAE